MSKMSKISKLFEFVIYFIFMKILCYTHQNNPYDELYFGDTESSQILCEEERICKVRSMRWIGQISEDANKSVDKNN